MQQTGLFNETEINYADELVEGRRLMGLKSTNLDDLLSTVAHLYLQCPQDMVSHYIAMIEEIGRRKTMIDFMDIIGKR